MHRLKDLRERKKLKQEDLAERLGVVQSTISMWETGNALPRSETLKRLAKILGCTIDELLKNTGKEKASS